MRIEEYLKQHAALRGSKTALVTSNKRLSFDELDDLTGRLAAALTANGVKKGDRVLVFMDNRWEAVVSIFAVLRAGAVFSPINASTKADKLSYIIDNCQAAAVLTMAKLMPVVTKACDGRPVFVVSTPAPGGRVPEGAESFESCLNIDLGSDQPAGNDTDLAMLIYTSGSTGRPKGAMMTHRNIDAAAESITTYLRNTSDDIILNVLPLAFDYGLYQLLMSVRLGATLVLEKSFVFPQAIFERIREEGATGFPLVPTMAAMILQMSDIKPGFLPSLRYITNTAAALPSGHIGRLRELFPDADLYSMYGLTECKRCTYLPPEELDRRPDSVGIAIPNTEAFVADEDGRRLPSGEIGELVIRGPHIMQGYWRDEEATARVLRPHVGGPEPLLHTGDLFRMDDEGFLYFVGRKDDIIKTRGEKVAPKEVEAVLHAHPGIAEAVVTGIADPVLGHAIAALVVISDDTLSEDQIIRHCAGHLEDFMVPKLVEIRDSLPKTDTGKVSRNKAAGVLELAQ